MEARAPFFPHSKWSALLCLTLLGGMAACIILSTSCATGPKPSLDDPPLADGYHLLHGLTDSLSGADDIFTIRDASPRTKALVKQTAQLATEIKKQIDARRSKSNPLPVFEQRARSNIAARTAWQLLQPTSPFESTLLLSQVEATRYGAVLCEELSRDESDAELKKKLTQWQKRFENLHKSIFRQIRTSTPSPAS